MRQLIAIYIYCILTSTFTKCYSQSDSVVSAIMFNTPDSSNEIVESVEQYTGGLLTFRTSWSFSHSYPEDTSNGKINEYFTYVNGVLTERLESAYSIDSKTIYIYDSLFPKPTSKLLQTIATYYYKNSAWGNWVDSSPQIMTYTYENGQLAKLTTFHNGLSSTKFFRYDTNGHMISVVFVGEPIRGINVETEQQNVTKDTGVTKYLKNDSMNVVVRFDEHNKILSIDTIYSDNAGKITRKKSRCSLAIGNCNDEFLYYDEIGRLIRREYYRSNFGYPEVTKYSWKVIKK